jgi:hypothetical protein
MLFTLTQYLPDRTVIRARIQLSSVYFYFTHIYDDKYVCVGTQHEQDTFPFHEKLLTHSICTYDT